MVRRLLVTAVMAAGVGIGAPALAQERPRIAVIPFENTTTWWGWELGRTAASQLTVKLVNAGPYSMIERQRVEEVFKELALGQTGAIAKDKAAELGRLLGAEYLITGSLTSFTIDTTAIGFRGIGGVQTKGRSAMNARVINVTTGEIMAAAEATSDVTLARGAAGFGAQVGQVTNTSAWNPTLAERALEPAVEKLAQTLAAQKDRLPTGGAIKAAQLAANPPAIAGIGADGSVYIDQGQNAGISVGRRFTVLRIVDVIKDASGNVLDNVTKAVGVIEVTQVLARSSVCRVIEGKPGAKDLLQP